MINHTWALLQEKGIVQGDQPENKTIGSPWYVKVLLAFSGWLAAIFILGFIVIAFQAVFDSSFVAGIIGVMMVAGAFALLSMPANEFVEHLGLATSLAGQALIIFAIFDFANHNEISAWLMFTMLEIVLVVLVANFVHSVVSAFVAAIALSMALSAMHIPYVFGGIVMFGASFCWLNELRYPHKTKRLRAIGYGLTLGLIVLKGTTLFGYQTFDGLFSQKHEFLAYPWLGELMIGAVSLYVVWSILQRYKQPLSCSLSITTILTTLLICLISINVQGLIVGMVIICLGFFCVNRVLLGLGVVSLIFYTSSYYYLLETTLFEKSLSLLVVGCTLLFVRWLMLRFFPERKEALNE